MISNIRFRTSTTRRFVALVFGALALFGLAPVVAGVPGSGEWITTNTEFGETRHEGASAQAGEAFYVIGGRESDAVRIYDPFDGVDGSWSTGAASPIQLHHFQAVELDGLIYAIGAMTGDYPGEDPVGNVYIYDPLADNWTIGPPLPAARLRGSSGTVVHAGLIYWISGNTNGHLGPVTAMVDVYDPATGSFTALADIPHPRDHFFATIHQDSIYVIGGRRTGEVSAFEPTVPEIDVYDIASNVWATLPASTHLNPPRAAAATDRLGNEIIIAGGESGSQEIAHAEVQAFDPATGLWRDLANMITPRHAAQAIVSNQGFYVAAGSPFRGGPGGAVLDTEALYLAGETTPTGTPITTGTISAPASILFDSGSKVIPIDHQGGNQAVVVKNIQISGSSAFSLAVPFSGPFTLAPGAGSMIAVDYSDEGFAQSGLLTITDSNDLITTVQLEAEGGQAPTALFRVNAGGGLLGTVDDGPDWSADTAGNPSIYLASGGDSTNAFAVQAIEPTVPASTPAAIFETERWDPSGGAEMRWEFPVAEGTPVEIRLYLMNGFEGTSEPGERVFQLEVDGVLAFSEIDLAAEAGHQVGTVRSYQTTADGMVDIEFLHVTDNPLINGIEILQLGVQPGVLSALPNSVNFGQVLIGTAETRNVILGNEGGSGDPAITIDQIDFSNAAFSSSLAVGNSLAPGSHLQVAVTFEPDSTGLLNSTLSIAHSGSNSPLTINLAGDGIDEAPPPPIAFSFQNVTTVDTPTQLEFGPDGRLYVAELRGLIHAFSIERDESTKDYLVSASEVIDLIQTLPNHNDDGTPFLSATRNVTGLITAGTAANPILYVTSSDPRIDDPQADTNSGILSRLTWTGTEWIKQDLVRSLPRSVHDHTSNGMALDVSSGILYLAQGGNTNMGAPSFSFGYFPEYALSAAILSIDLDAIGDQTYDIPTLKGDVFGGQAGNNQAMIVPGGPVQVYSPGFRNPYDVLLTAAGRLYSFDNDSNTGWGGPPVNEGPGGTCTNATNESDSGTYGDNLHLITGPGYYAGHPNPTRGNRSNTFDGLSPIPAGLENPGECQFLIPGTEDGAIAINNSSTNGLAEYTATNFAGQMTGNIITTSWNGAVLRLSLNSSGDQVTEQVDLFTSLNGPLGVTAQGDSDPFPGTIWIGELFSGKVTVFEPQDFFECDPDSLDPAETSSNGYTYGDLIDNGLDPCNPAQIPPDFDQDFVSDLNDPDIDGDGIANEQDRFDFDADNGRGTPLPHRLAWSGEFIGTLGGMATYNAPGFTGLMAHPDTYISVFDQFNVERLIPGGAAGIFTVEEVTPGDAQLNTQENAFHFGVDVNSTSPLFTARTRIIAPFAGAAPQDNQSMGLVVGQGDQDNFLKLITHANGGDGGIRFAREILGVAESQQVSEILVGADYVDLYLVIDPAASSVTASHVIARNGVRDPRTQIGQPYSMPASWLSDTINGPAIGIISTSSGADPFSASWGFVEVYEGAGDDAQPELIVVAEPGELAFDAILVGAISEPQTITLTNTGEDTAIINNLGLGGADAQDFTLPEASDNCSSAILAVSESCSFAIRFQPTETGVRSAQVEISTTAGDFAVALQGQGLVALDLAIGDSPDPVIAGNELTYSLVVSNLTNAAADNVALAITLPAATTLLGTAGCLEDPAGIPTCSIGSIPANQSSEVTVTVEVSGSATGSLLFETTASAASLLEPVTEQVTTAVTIAADLDLVMGGNVIVVNPETMELLYVIIVGNAGPSDALSAMVMTQLEPGLENVAWTCQAEASASCSASGIGEIDDLADLSVGTSVTYQINATASNMLVEQGITSSADVTPTGETTDPNMANNSDSVTIGDRLFNDRFEGIEE